MQWLDELNQLQGRGEIKRWGQQIDQDPALKAQLISALRARGDVVSSTVSGKKLVRQWRNRSEQAQIRKNPIHLNEAFVCAWCGFENQLSSHIRDHCKRCLRSLHLDVVPGDRAAQCGAIMHPIEMTLSGGRTRLTYQCSGCDFRHHIWAHPEDEIPPSMLISDLPNPGSADG